MTTLEAPARYGRHRKRTQAVMLVVMAASLIITLGFLAALLAFVGARGLPAISFEFLTQMPRRAMTAGGIMPAILGTLYLVIGSTSISAVLGVATAIYLAEYARDGIAARLIRTGISNLAGVPSVVFGLFGLAVFVKLFGFGVSILSGSLTLAIVVLPTIIRSAEEAIVSTPQSYREASLALGATKWQTVRYAVMPSALPGILTGCILAVARAAGETAPIMLTAATFLTTRLPSSVFDEVQALAYHIFALITEGTRPEAQAPIAYGAAVVLLALVIGLNAGAIVLRARYEKRR